MFFRKSAGNAVIDFLNRADHEIERAYITRDGINLSRVLAPRLFDLISDSLYDMQKVVRGNSQYKKSKWSVIGESGSVTSVLKETKFEKIKLTRNICLAVGQDRKEIWEVVKNGNTLLVQSIKEV
jgi:hypothetical protein